MKKVVHNLMEFKADPNGQQQLMVDNKPFSTTSLDDVRCSSPLATNPPLATNRHHPPPRWNVYGALFRTEMSHPYAAIGIRITHLSGVPPQTQPLDTTQILSQTKPRPSTRFKLD